MKKECKYPKCYYHKPKAKSYCTNACAFDHADLKRLQREARVKERSHA